MAGIATGPTRFVFVDYGTFCQYHADLERIGREWPPCPPEREHWEINATMRAAARRNLREDVKRAVAMGYGGQYPIPV